jgi:aspergillopepsin I
LVAAGFKTFASLPLLIHGSSLWYAPKRFVSAYWKEVEGAVFEEARRGWFFSCNSKLPDITMAIGDGKVTVPGINMNYSQAGANRCYGGLQNDLPMGFSIFGDVFLKGLCVVFEDAPGSRRRLGFAQGR